MLRILHTSDWHLGHTLHDLGREQEHAAFLHFLLEVIREHRVDALLIAGDIFESANPPASAQATWYDFLARAHARFPGLDIVVIGGNHDSAARLDAPKPLLDGLASPVRGSGRVHVVGGLPRKEDGHLDLARLIVPLRAGDSERAAAWVAAVPFLRPADLPRVEEDAPRFVDDVLIDGVWRTYDEVLRAARKRREPGQALIAMGHCYMSGSEVSELSERKVLGGNQHALPAELFPQDVAYVALGHLHLAQEVGRANVRYSGSPIPLSLRERSYEHQVVLVDLDGERFVRARSIPVPRRVHILRVPEVGAESLATVLEELALLDEDTDRVEAGPVVPSAPAQQAILPLPGPITLDLEEPAETNALGPPPGTKGAPLDRPLLEVQVRLLEPDPSLRRTIEAALEGKRARLVKLGVSYVEVERDTPSLPPEQHLRELAPEEVFARCFAATFDAEPSDDLLAAFHELVDVVHQGL